MLTMISMTTMITSTTIDTSIFNPSTCSTTFTVNNTNLLITCPSNVNLSLLPIKNYSFEILNQIILLKIEGYNNTRGPLQTIPSNICNLPNLQVLNISHNHLTDLDISFLSLNLSCLNTLQILDMSDNYLPQLSSNLTFRYINVLNKALLINPNILSNKIHFLLNDQIAQDSNICDTQSLNNLIQSMKNLNLIIEIQCDCSSFNLLSLSEKLTDEFSCDNISKLNKNQFENLNEMDCLENNISPSFGSCQFKRLTESSPLNNKIRLLMIIPGSIGLILIIVCIIYGFYHKRKSTVKGVRISVLSTAPNPNVVYL